MKSLEKSELAVLVLSVLCVGFMIGAIFHRKHVPTLMTPITADFFRIPHTLGAPYDRVNFSLSVVCQGDLPQWWKKEGEAGELRLQNVEVTTSRGRRLKPLAFHNPVDVRYKSDHLLSCDGRMKVAPLSEGETLTELRATLEMPGSLAPGDKTLGFSMSIEDATLPATVATGPTRQPIIEVTPTPAPPKPVPPTPNTTATR